MITVNYTTNTSEDVESGSSRTYSAGSTLTINGVLAGTPTGGTLNLSNCTITFPGEVGKIGIVGTSIASASSINIGAATGQSVHITGTTTITALGTATAGVIRTLIFDGNLILTYNATSLLLPSSANFSTLAGDVMTLISLGSGNWKCIGYQRISGIVISANTAVQPALDLNSFFSNFGSGTTFSIDSSTGQFFFDTGAIISDGSGNLTAVSFDGEISGTATNNNAAAGQVGEYVTSAIAVGSAVSLATATSKTVTSISLTAGDWDVTGVVDFHPGALTTGSYFQGGVSITNNTLGGQDQYASAPMALAAGLGVDVGLVSPVSRISLSTTTTIYLTCQAGFSTSTMTAYGTIRARRVR